MKNLQNLYQLQFSCLKSTIETRGAGCRSGVSIINFGQISLIDLIFLLLTLSM